MNERIHAHLKRVEGYKYDVTFDELPGVKLTTDEPVPVGKGEGVSAAMLLSSAVGHCLTSSLLFCMEKSRAKVKDLATEVELVMERNQRARWRVKQIKVRMKPLVESIDAEKLERCKGIFQDFCIVSASIRDGIKIDVEVEK